MTRRAPVSVLEPLEPEWGSEACERTRYDSGKYGRRESERQSGAGLWLRDGSRECRGRQDRVDALWPPHSSASFLTIRVSRSDSSLAGCPMINAPFGVARGCT